MKAYKAEVYIIDFDGLGSAEIANVLRDARYPNRCIIPHVRRMHEVDIGEWSDDHPLNQPGCGAEFDRLFAFSKGEPYGIAPDNDGHWYLIPDQLRGAWDAWRMAWEVYEDTEEGMEPDPSPPRGIERLDGSPTRLRFRDPSTPR